MITRRLSVLFLLFALTRNISFGQESILWRVNIPGFPNPSYILCTSEISGVENFDINAVAAPVMDEVNTVAFFCIPDASDKQNIPTLMSSPDEKTLKGYYKRDDRIRLELMVRDKLNTEIENLYSLKPIYVMQQFREEDHKNGAGFQQKSLFDLALQKTKPTLSLLTLRQVSSAMDGIDFDTQAFILSNYMLNENAYIESDNKILDYYKSQKMNDLAQEFYSIEQDAYLSVYVKDLTDLVTRKIDALSSQQTVLYIINSEFVVGEEGIIAKLRKLGFSVAAVPVDLKKRDMTIQTTTTTTTTEIQNDNIPPDGFPEIASATVNNVLIDPTDISIIQSDEIVANYGIKKYRAFTDPFNDMFNYASSDTLFLEYWYDMKGADANFKIKVPVKSDWEVVEEDNILGKIKRYVYQVNHAKSDLFYSFSYSVYPPTFSIPDKNAFFDDFFDRSMNAIHGKPIGQRIISTPSYTGREFTAIVGDSNFVRCLFFLQDNILYQMLVGGPGDNAYSAYAEAFLNSFRTTGASINNWYMFEQPAFTCYLPTPPSKNTQSYNVGSGAMNLVTYTSDDYKENITYSISIYNYPPGYNFKGKKAFYEELIANAERQYFGKASSVTKVTKNGIEGRYVVMPLMNKKTLRIYFFFDKNAVYQYSAMGDPAGVLSINVQRFFDSFMFNGEGDKN